ncbi:MAG: hypothetical protein GY703_23575 [Gammaproteobacteria bacterium]|nr:hypothetical protein [Gammaproteobacteria bacterium]
MNHDAAWLNPGLIRNSWYPFNISLLYQLSIVQYRSFCAIRVFPDFSGKLRTNSELLNGIPRSMERIGYRYL